MPEVFAAVVAAIHVQSLRPVSFPCLQPFVILACHHIAARIWALAECPWVHRTLLGVIRHTVALARRTFARAHELPQLRFPLTLCVKARLAQKPEASILFELAKCVWRVTPMTETLFARSLAMVHG